MQIGQFLSPLGRPSTGTASRTQLTKWTTMVSVLDVGKIQDDGGFEGYIVFC